ncbi:hypothetical protein [Paenibacillus aceti]|uniref:Uncharacterized protein n=1 Tax=Paenibacillus aceti TaxID=1820010 RepID=A0ABQ1VUZ3_9BACL|nr:hypothetical protein [Paenibacillus aceti]GGF97613.1 hypothetical protein GCM10010913_19140 [Paenibacillus aceti]
MTTNRWNPLRKITATMKKVSLLVGFMLICWFVFLASSRAVILTYDVIWAGLGNE